MNVHISKTGHYPDHVHGCLVHVGGTDAASKNADGEKVSDACFWDADHDQAFKTKHAAAYEKAKK